jgi:hypothetical protein
MAILHFLFFRFRFVFCWSVGDLVVMADGGDVMKIFGSRWSEVGVFRLTSERTSYEKEEEEAVEC